MGPLSKHGRLWHLFTFLSTLHLVIAQINLGIRRDASLRYRDSNNFPVVYSAVVEFPAGTFTGNRQNDDGRLAWLAQRASTEMMAFQPGGNPYNPAREERPTIMAALKVGNTVYFASSMKWDSGGVGIDAFIYRFFSNYPEEAVELEGALNMCQLATNRMEDGGMDHNKDAHCGEPMVLAAFYKNQGFRETIKNKNAVIAAWHRGHGTIIKPCTYFDGRYGCRQIVQSLNIEWVRANQATTPVTHNPIDRYQMCLAPTA